VWKARTNIIRHFRNKKRECLKDKISVLEGYSKNQNFKNLYRMDIVGCNRKLEKIA
jgi:hypothetical protein